MHNFIELPSDFFFNRKLFFKGGFPKEQENQTKTELNEIIIINVNDINRRIKNKRK